MKTPPARQRHILRVTIGYGIGAALWILLSDTLLAPLIDPSAIQRLSTVKGLFFVLATTLFLFIALRATPDQSGATAKTPAPPSPAIAPWSGVWGYLFAVATTLITLSLRIALPIPLSAEPMLILFIFPIIISAMAGGLGPGLTATMLAAFGIDYCAIPPLHSLAIAAPQDQFHWGFLVGNGVLVSLLSEKLHRLGQDSAAIGAQYQDLINAQPAGIYRIRVLADRPWTDSTLTSPDSTPYIFETINDHFCEILGVSRLQLEADPGLFGRLLHPEDSADFIAANQEANARKIPFNWEGRIISGDKVRWVHLESLPRQLPDGNLIWTGILTDISERKRAEAALGESEATYRSLIEHMLNSVVRARLIFADGKPVDLEYLAVNPAFAKVTGIATPVVGRRISEVIPGYSRDNQESLEIFGRVALSGEPARWEHYLPALDRWFSFSIYSPAQGEVIIISDNITEQKKAELALRENEARLRAISDNLPDGYIYQSMTGTEGKARFIYVSAGVSALHCLSQEEVLRDASLIYRQVDPEQIEALARAEKKSLVDLSDFAFELHISRPDQSSRWLYIRSRPRRKADGQLVWDGVVTDITGRKAMQGQLLQAQKMEFVGRLAGGVAHDFNNMLTLIGGHVELVIEQTPSNDPRYPDLLEIQDAARRSANLTRQLLAFARKQTVSPVELEINETLAAMLKMLQRLIGENINLAWRPGRDLGRVKIDPSQLDQILANLAVNARDAIGGGVGEVTIETANRHFDKEYCATHPDLTPGDYVELAVSDSGCGMDGEVLAHIFEPFFTTKEDGRGTGLGLATVYGIVRQNRGAVNVYSEPGKGTTFRIYLPRHHEETEATKESPQPAPPPNGTETVLLVEDEASILQLGKRFVEKLGYRILTATTPGEALRLAAGHEGTIDLLITDVVMPEMNGKQLAAHLQEIRPGLKCLFMSGYTADAIARQGVLDEGICFLPKPFSAQEMAVKIREALGR